MEHRCDYEGKVIMNIEMAYLLGMIYGNGEIRRGVDETIVLIDIPHKKMYTEQCNDVRIYLKASITDIRNVIEPLVGVSLKFTQKDNVSTLSFSKRNDEYVMREILRLVSNYTHHINMRLSDEIFTFKETEKRFFLRGFADVTGYIRRSNYFMKKHMHRVYLEIPKNWYLTIDICNLLKSIDIPVHSIDWAHPNMRDGKLIKYFEGKKDFWKKEHQIKIWANEFLPIGFAVIHKHETLNILAHELTASLLDDNKKPRKITHKFYWETSVKRREKPVHPSEFDEFIPESIRGRHYNSWKDIAIDLGYGE